MNVEQTKEAIVIMQAYVDGKKIEIRAGGRWNPVAQPTFNFNAHEYRVAPVVPDSFDFSHLADKFNFVARDEDGEVYAYEDKPRLSRGFWDTDSGEYIRVNNFFASYRNNGCDWKESLLVRPGYQDA